MIISNNLKYRFKHSDGICLPIKEAVIKLFVLETLVGFLCF